MIIDLLSPKFKARLFIEDVMPRLNFSKDELTVLIEAGHLVPSGKPNKFGRKVFSFVYIYQCALDAKWMNDAELILQKKWKKNHELYPRNEKSISEQNESKGLSAGPNRKKLKRKRGGSHHHQEEYALANSNVGTASALLRREDR